MGDPLLDQFTSVDEKVQAILDYLQVRFGEVPETEAGLPTKHTTYYFDGTIALGNVPTDLNIRADPSQGLGVVGKELFIINDGLNSLQYRWHDGNGWSKWITLYAGEHRLYTRDQDLWFDVVQVQSLLGTTARLEVSP